MRLKQTQSFRLFSNLIIFNNKVFFVIQAVCFNSKKYDFEEKTFCILGKWYEIEQFFNVSELVLRCVSVTFERRVDGKFS